MTSVVSNKDQDCFVTASMAVLLHGSRLFGTAPLHISGTKNGWHLRFSLLFYVYGYLLVLGLHAGSLTGLTLDMINFLNKEQRLHAIMIQFVWCLEFVVVMSAFAVGVLGARTRMIEFFTCLNVIKKINSQISPSVIGPYETREAIKCVKALAGLLAPTWHIIGYMINLYTKVHTNANTNWPYFCYIIELVLSYSIQVQFVFIAQKINDELKSINKSLQEFTYIDLEDPSISFLIHDVSFPSERKIKAGFQSKKDIQQKIRTFTLSFATLSDVVRQVNTSFGNGLSLILGLHQLYLLVTPYFFIAYLTIQFSIISCLSHIVFYTFHMSYLTMMVHPGYKMEIELDKMQVLISKLMGRLPTSEDPVYFELDLLHKQIKLNQISYAPSSLTSLSRRLIPTFFITAKAFLITVLSFRAIVKEREDCDKMLNSIPTVPSLI